MRTPIFRRYAVTFLAGVLKHPENGLSSALRMLLAQLQGELKQLQNQIDEADAEIAKAAVEHQPCRRLMAIPGVGPLTATAVVASIGNGASFGRGRSFATRLGPVPGQYSTGGKQKLLASVNEETAICESSWCTEPERLCSAGKTVTWSQRMAEFYRRGAEDLGKAGQHFTLIQQQQS